MSTSANNGNTQRARPRGAIRTHLGRKRTGARGRSARYANPERDGHPRQEDIFDRVLRVALDAMARAGETTLSAADRAVETACDGLVAAGEFTSENAERLRHLLRHELLHRDDPALTFRTGDITSAGILTCEGCGWTIHTSRTSVLPPCPQCAETAYRKSA